MKPWHDTPMHDCADGTKGPIAPLSDDPNNLDSQVEILRCCACGSNWYEDDIRRIVHAWWSAGAYEGKEAARKAGR